MLLFSSHLGQVKAPRATSTEFIVQITKHFGSSEQIRAHQGNAPRDSFPKALLQGWNWAVGRALKQILGGILPLRIVLRSHLAVGLFQQGHGGVVALWVIPCGDVFHGGELGAALQGQGMMRGVVAEGGAGAGTGRAGSAASHARS